MSYKAGKFLGGEQASKLGHLDIVHSDFVRKILDQFLDPNPQQADSTVPWSSIKFSQKPLSIIFAVDGSFRVIASRHKPSKRIAVIKVALLKLDRNFLKEIKEPEPHPLLIRDLLSRSTVLHTAIFPLRGIKAKNKDMYQAIREIIWSSLRDPALNGEPYKTLKWLFYEGWNNQPVKSPDFACPHCRKVISGLPYMEDMGECEHCGGSVFLTDVIGFHLEMEDEMVSDSFAGVYTAVYETLMLFTGIRILWEQGYYNLLKDSLFLKDGPLTLRGQYSKLVIPIRKFLSFARDRGIPIHLAGQEKTGLFVDHLDVIAKQAPRNSYFILSNEYIRREIQQNPHYTEPYGLRTNYGSKVFVNLDIHHHFVLSIPTGEYIQDPTEKDLIGFDSIIATLPTILSYRYENALIPLELVNDAASVSNYPSTEVLEKFLFSQLDQDGLLLYDLLKENI